MGHKCLLPFLEISSFSNLEPFEDVEDAVVDFLVAATENEKPQSHHPACLMACNREFSIQKGLFRLRFRFLMPEQIHVVAHLCRV